MLSMILGVHTTQTFVAKSLEKDTTRSKDLPYTISGELNNNCTIEANPANVEPISNGDVIKVRL